MLVASALLPSIVFLIDEFMYLSEAPLNLTRSPNIADASYENTMIIYSNNVVNTSMIGTYPLVYTALDDLAGNLGPSITRIITVSDSTPVMLNSLRINTSNNNPAYAKTGDIIAVTLIANQPISNANTSIQNMAVNNTIQGNTLYANYTVQTVKKEI